MRNLRSILFCLTLLLQSAATVFGQVRETIKLPGHLIDLSIWRENEDNLPSYHVRDMLENAGGLVWLATDVGLVSFDGHVFTNHDQYISDANFPNLFRILEDANHNIWLFFLNGKSSLRVIIYDPYQKTSIPVEIYLGRPLNFTISAKDKITKIDSAIWITDSATGKIGCFGADGHWLEVNLNQFKNNECFPAPNGNFWVHDLDGQNVCLVNINGQSLKCWPILPHLHFKYYQGPDGLVYLINMKPPVDSLPLEVYTLTEENGLILESAKERPFLNWGNSSKYSYKSVSIRANNSTGTEIEHRNDGVRIFQHGRLIYTGLRELLLKYHKLDIINGIFVLKDGSFWIPLIGGLLRLTVKPNLFKTYLTDNDLKISTRGLTVVKEHLYANSYLGLYKVDLNSGKTQNLSLKLNLDGFGLGMVQKDGNIWLTDIFRPVSLFDPVSERFEEIPVNGYEAEIIGFTFSFLQNGAVLMGRRSGLWKYSKTSGMFESLALRDTSVYSIHQNKWGLWLGTSVGLFLLDTAGRKIQHFLTDTASTGKVPDVRYIFEDSSADFWLGTNRGLWHWKPFSNKVEIFNRGNHVLHNNQVHAVFENKKGYLWLSTNNGLVQFDKKSHATNSYFSKDGLPSSEFNFLSFYRDEHGQVYLGGVSGVSSFNPDSIEFKYPSRTPSINLLDLNVSYGALKKNINKAPEALFPRLLIDIEPGVSSLSVRFTIPNFENELYTYRWRFQRGDSSWNFLNEPAFDLFYLPDGEYNLEIQAFKIGGQSGPPSRLLIPLRVKKPLYLQIWFLVFLILFTLWIILLIAEWRKNQVILTNIRLANELDEKTAQLRQERDTIAHQAERLLQNTEEKSKFFEEISHEIRTPLTLILGPATDMLKRANLTEAQSTHLQGIEQNAQKILRMVDEIMELSMAEAGLLHLDLTKEYLSPFMSQVFNRFTHLANEKGIRYHLLNEVSDQLMVLIDPAKVEKVINNLISNAINYTPGGGIVSVSVTLLPDPRVQIQVQDSGIGIAPKELGKIFERHYRISWTRSGRSDKGFGVGLATAKQYANFMAGALQVESKEGSGSLFTFQFPVQIIDQVTVQPGLEVGQKQEASGLEEMSGLIQPNLPDKEPTDRAHILVVEDTKEMQEYLYALLSPSYRVSVCDSGLKALAWLQDQHPDLMISDLMMPDMDGLQLLSTLKNEAAQVDFPVIILTAQIKNTDRIEALSRGADGFLTKPFEPEELLRQTAYLLRENDPPGKTRRKS